MFACLFAVLSLSVSVPHPLQVAVTVDDLPATPSDLKAIQSAFHERHLPPVVGFVNGALVEGNPDKLAALQDWVAAGDRLGSHTYTHANLNDIGLAAYLADIDRNEPLLQAATGETDDWRLFRFPFSNEGATPADRQVIRSHLRDNGYRVVPVTIDPMAWAWDAAYARCVAKGETSLAFTIQRGMIADTLWQLLWADEMARYLLGRPIKHVMATHAGSLLANSAADLLQALSEHGVAFVDLEEALRDPVYAMDVESPAFAGGNLLDQIKAARGVQGAPEPMAHPTAWLAEQCL